MPVDHAQVAMKIPCASTKNLTPRVQSMTVASIPQYQAGVVRYDMFNRA